MIELKCNFCGHKFPTRSTQHLMHCPRCRRMVSPDRDKVKTSYADDTPSPSSRDRCKRLLPAAKTLHRS